jgi:hypothetical protein
MTLATGLCLLVHGCEDVNGGAVELSWKLRPASSSLEDKFVGCKVPLRDDLDRPPSRTGEVIAMRLDWEVIDQSGVRADSAEWECADSHGVTGFDLPEGTAFLTVTPLCKEGEPAKRTSYIAPAAEQRRVIVGDTVSLGAIELVVTMTSCKTQCCICDPEMSSVTCPGT